MKKKYLLTTVVISILYTSTWSGIKPNPIISRFKPIYASFPGSPSALVNGKFGETAWLVSDSSWIAIKLDVGISAIFFTWNTTNYMWSDEISKPTLCAEGLPIPVDYNILVSGNSTNGIDGDWVVIDSVRGNLVASRGHTITNFKDKFWVKMFVIKGGGKIDEIEVFDISNGKDDTWLFLGTSITANAFKQPVPSKTFSDYIREYLSDTYPNIFPAIIRGGIGCATLHGILSDIKKIIEASGKVRYFAIEIGLNEAWGGKTENLKSFTNNLQALVKICKENGIEPVIAKIPATNPEKCGWQVSEEYQKAIDEIIKKNNLNAGPDFYNWFLKNPDELKDDGIHPTPRGGASIQRLWADAVYKLYQEKK